MKEIEYHRLDRAREQNEKLYDFLLESLAEADLARMMNVNNIRVVDEAVAPTKPVRPQVGLLTRAYTAPSSVCSWARHRLATRGPRLLFSDS